MKKVLILMVMACAATAVMAQVKPAIPRDAALEAKVEKTLAKMTLDETLTKQVHPHQHIVDSLS